MIVEPGEIREGATIRRHGHVAPSTCRIVRCARLGGVGLVNADGSATIFCPTSAWTCVPELEALAQKVWLPRTESIRFWNPNIFAAVSKSVDRFLVESPHDAGECKRVVKSVYAQGFLYNCDWGCTGGVHKAWVTIEAENESQALWVVPPILRDKATATKLAKFDPEIVKGWKEE